MSAVEDELRAAFHQGTADLPHTPDPWTRTTRGIARHRARRRGAAAVLTVAALLGVGVAAVPWRDDRPVPADRDRRGFGPVVTDTEMSRWPTRGDLAGDAALLDQVRQYMKVRGEVLGIPYAGTFDGEGLVMALVRDEGEDTGEPDGGTAFVLRGKVGTPIAAWSPSGQAEEFGKGPALVYAPDEPVRPVLVVTRSRGVDVSYSTAPTFVRSGAVERSYVPVGLDNGVAVVPAGPAVGSAMYILSDDGSPPFWTTLSGTSSSAPPPPESTLKAVAAAPACRGLARTVDLHNALDGVDPVVRDRLTDATIAPVWCRKAGAMTTMLLAVTLPDGPSFQVSASVIVQDDGTHVGADGDAVPVPWGRARDFPAAFQNDALDDERKEGDPLPVVVSAPGGASVELVARGGVRLGSGRLDEDGYVRLLLPSNAFEAFEDEKTMIVVRDRRGAPVERVPVNRPERDDPIGLRVLAPGR